MLSLLKHWELKVTTNNSRKSQQCLKIFTRLTIHNIDLQKIWTRTFSRILESFEKFKAWFLTYWEFIINFKNSEFWFLKFSVLSLSLNLGHVSCWTVSKVPFLKTLKIYPPSSRLKAFRNFCVKSKN